MDMNQLFYHHQMALIEADRAKRDGAGAAHSDLSHHYAKRIDEYRAQRGLTAYFPDTDAAPEG
jgi:hypothetical protein